MEMMANAASQVDSVSPQTANDEASKGAVLLDVRSAEEFQHGFIEGSVHANRGFLEFFADPASPRHKPELDPEKRIIVICRSGARAVLAGLTLKELGFEDVAVMTGGLEAWKAAGLPVEEHEYSLV